MNLKTFFLPPGGGESGAAPRGAGRKARGGLVRIAGLAAPFLIAGPFTVRALPPVAPETCVGDQNDDGSVSLAELVSGVEIALGGGFDFCAVFDANRDGRVDVGDLIESIQDSLHGCGAQQRVDLSGFREFRFERQPALGFCPPLGEVFAASLRHDGADFALEISSLEEGQPGVDDCLPDVLPEDRCLVVRSAPSRLLREDESARALDVFGDVMIRDAPISECRGCFIDPCVINAAEWDSLRTTDYVCDDRNRIDAAQTAAIVDLLEEMRSEVCGDGMVEGEETCDDGGACRFEGGTGCASDQDCASGQNCVEGSCVRRCTGAEGCSSGVCIPAGGDGCAANCTMEDVRQTLLDTSRSLVHVQTFNSVITLHLAAAQTLCTGRPRAERVFDPQGSVVSEPGEVPVAMKATEAVFDPASVPGLACACVRQVAVPDLYGPNLSAVGKIGCGARGLGANNYKVIRDHNTTPGDPDNGTSGGLVIPQLPDDPECDDESAFPSGMVSRACREHSGDPACDDPFSFFHPGICNSGSMIEVRSGTTPRGSDWIENSTAIGLLADGGACRTDRPRNPNGSCMLRDYGEDCLPCTGDDLRLGTPITLVLTTGTAQAAVYDANNVRPSSPIDAGSGTTCSSDAECRPHERCRRTCEESGLPCAGDGDCAQPGIEDVCRPPRCEVLCGGFTRCLSSRSGEPFDCDLLLAEPEGGQLTGALVFARPDVDGFRIGDNVTTGTLRFE